MSTLAELRATARDLFLRIDPNGRIRGNKVLDAYINRGYMQTQKDGQNNRNEQQDSGTFNTTGGVNSYVLPSDFLKFSAVLCNGSIIDQINRQDIYKSNQIDAVGTPVSYFIYGGEIGFYPIPQTTDRIDYLYNKRLPTITDTQDSELPSDFDEAICLYAVYLGMLSVEKREKAMDMLNEYNQTISALLMTYIINNDTLTYGLDRGDPILPSPRAL